MKTILITGASSGFGRDTAETLARAGHQIFAGVRDPAGRNAAIAAMLRAQHIVPVALDVTSEASVEAAIAQVLAGSGGRLDVLVNNAGIASMGVSEGFSADQLRQLFDVNLFGVQRMMRAALPTLRRQREGLVITVGSILGRVTFPFLGLYGASKFALEALMDSYGYELSLLGIEVTLVQPSAYPTGLYAAIQQPADGARAAEYGSVGAIPGKMVETFMAMFQGANAPDPHDVAVAIAALVATPPGRRPHRVVVGQAFGADILNQAAAPVQQQVIESLGLGTLAAV